MTATVWPEDIYKLDAGLGLTVCVVHQGAHCFYMGACIDVRAGRRPAFDAPRLRRCSEPGCNFAEETPHSHQPPVEPVRVEIDETRLATGIAIALDQLMQRRREARTATTSSNTVEAPMPSTRQGERAPSQPESRQPSPVTVWEADGAR